MASATPQLHGSLCPSCKAAQPSFDTFDRSQERGGKMFYNAGTMTENSLSRLQPVKFL